MRRPGSLICPFQYLSSPQRGPCSCSPPAAPFSTEAPWPPSPSRGKTGQWILAVTFGLSELPPDSLEKVTRSRVQPGSRFPFFSDPSHPLALVHPALSRLRSPAAIQFLQRQRPLLCSGHPGLSRSTCCCLFLSCLASPSPLCSPHLPLPLVSLCLIGWIHPRFCLQHSISAFLITHRPKEWFKPCTRNKGLEPPLEPLSSFLLQADLLAQRESLKLPSSFYNLFC